jgi:Protein of unknown function (DUF2853)
MATDWAADVKKYAPDADDGVIAGIVRYCGIALRKVDSSLVAFSDPKELDRVRENFLKKKLGLTQADKTLDAAIAKVGETMKADRTKNRVTVYYLLAANYKKLGLFAPKAKATAKAAGTAALAGAAGLAAASATKAPAKKKDAPAKQAAPAKTKAAAAAKAPAVATTKKTATKKKVAIKAAAAPQGLMDKAAGAGGAVAATTPAATGAASVAKDTAVKTAGAADKTGAAVSQPTRADDEADSGLGWLWLVLGAALLLFLLWWLL